MPKCQTELASAWPPTAETSREAGHEPQSPLRAIRAKCLDCACYQIGEVRLCEATQCALWPFRAGRHPWHTLAQKAAGNPPGFHEGEAFLNEGALP